MEDIENSTDTTKHCHNRFGTKKIDNNMPVLQSWANGLQPGFPNFLLQLPE